MEATCELLHTGDVFWPSSGEPPREGPVVRIRFPPAGSLVRTQLPEAGRRTLGDTVGGDRLAPTPEIRSGATTPVKRDRSLVAVRIENLDESGPEGERKYWISAGLTAPLPQRPPTAAIAGF